MDKKVIHTVFEATVKEFPLNNAVEWKDGEMSYANLNEAANRLAHLLLTLGVKRDDVSATLLGHGCNQVIALLGIFKSGAIYMPLDAKYGENHWRQLYEHIQPQVIITSLAQLETVKKYHDRFDYSIPLMIVSETDSAGMISYKVYRTIEGKYTKETVSGDLPISNPEIKISGDDPNYIFFTSGSTGLPKAVLGAHKSLSHFIHWESAELQISETDRVGQLTSFSFDASLRDVFVPLANGTTLCLPEPELREDLSRFATWLASEKITLLHTVPTLFRLLTAAARDTGDKTAFTQLRNILLAGEKLYKKDILAWRDFFGNDTVIINLYGATESTLVKSFYRVPEQIPGSPSEVLPVGKPISNTALIILNKAGELCRIQEEGSIYIKTPFLSKGYYKAPEATAEVFVQNPLTNDKDIIYKTGDYGKYDTERNVIVLGRDDSLIKISGVRADLNAIEQTIRTFSGLGDVKCLAHQDSEMETAIYCFYTSNVAMDSALREHCTTRLSAYELPSHFIHLTEFPVNVNGKTDSKALANMINEGLPSRANFIAPTTETETKLAGLWQEVLDVEQIGVRDDFLLLGGNSIKLIRLKSRIYRDMGVEIGLQDLFINSSLENMANCIDRQTASEYEGIEPLPFQESYELSPAQYRIWVLSQFEGASQAYNISSIVPVDGPLKVDQFENAIQRVIERHEILRTIFKENAEGDLRQWILPAEEVNFSLDFKDFRKSKEPANSVDQYHIESANTTFDLEQWPLLRAGLLRLTNDEYLLSFNMHHIIGDAWSMEVLSDDVMRFYETEDSHDNEPLSIQYKDFAAWQISQLTGDQLQGHKDYWLKKLDGELAVLELPSHKVRPTVKSSIGETLNTVIDKQIVSDLHKFSAKNGGTLFMGLLAAFKVLLYRFTGETDCIVGSPVAGRPYESLEGQIGFYINTLALRDEIDGDDSFEKHFQKIKQTTLEAYDHQLYPFDSLVEELELTHDTSRSAVFDIMLILQNARTLEVENFDSSLTDKIVVENSTTSKFDLTFNITEVGSWLSLRAEYNTDVYDRELIERFIKAYKLILSNLMEAPDRMISEVGITSEEDKDQILNEFNNTKVTYQSPNYLELFAEQTQLWPDSVALSFQNKQLTYTELDEKSNQLAHLLAGRGVKKDTLVPICFERSFEMIIAVLGVLKSGAAYVPLDPTYPVERIDFILKEIGAQIILSTEALKNILPDGIEQIELGDTTLNDFPKEKVETVVESNQLAYVIYTSGTTGKPKGVMNEHGGLLNRLLWMKDDLVIDHSSVFLQKTPYTFDVSVWELLLPFICGSRLVIARPEGHKDPFYLESILKEEKVTVVHFVPSMLEIYLDSSQNSSDTLEHLVCSGEALPAKLVEKCKSVLSNTQLHNYYGPTEAAIDVTAIDLTHKNVEHTVSIGFPVANTQIYIVDEKMAPVPIGVVGELLIGGVQVARGYLKREELTKEKFIQSPFSAGGRLYRTGDLASWNPDGSIAYWGRMDDQIKIRGNRVELSEITSVITAHDHIAKAVTVVKSVQSEPVIAAYYVCKTPIEKKELQTHVRTILPDYMVPSYWVPIEEFPVTANGKLNRKALPEISDKDLILEQYVAPVSVEERVLAGVWEQVLRRSPIGVKDSFFNLGGDSIKSIQVVSKVKQEGYTLKVEQVLRYPVLENLAKHLVRHEKSIDQSRVVGRVALTPVQHRFFEKIPVTNYFNQAVVLRSEDRLGIEYLNRSVAMLVDHHDALRTHFNLEVGEWVQNIEKDGDGCYQIHSYDLEKAKAPEKEMAQLGKELQEGLDITAGSLMQVGHFRLAAGDYLVIIIHHLVVDGLSWRILLEDLSTLYTELKNGRKPSLPPKTNSYKTWANTLLDYASSDTLIAEASYWNRELGGELRTIPKKKEEQPQNNTSANHSFTLEKALTEDMQTRAHRVYGTDMNDLLLTALGMAIKEVFNYNRLVVEMEGHGREEIDSDVDISRTVGWFTTMFLFVLDIPNEELSQNLVSVKESLRKIPKKGIGYGVLKYLSNIDVPSLEHSIVFNYLGDVGSGVSSEENAAFKYASANIGAYKHPENNEMVPLNVSAMIVSGEITVSLTFLESHFTETEMSALTQSYKDWLVEMVRTLAKQTEKRLTPSDLTFKGLSIAQLDSLNSANNVQDIYGLSPLQQGIFFTWMSNPSPFLYFEQTSYRLKANTFNIVDLKEAYTRLISRYDVLRTSFTNKHGDLLQIVWKKVPIHFTHTKLDANLSGEEKVAKINEIKQKDRARGFDLEEPSQMRLHIIELSNNRYEFIWSHHHILMDGWCFGILFDDFFRILDSVSNKLQVELESPPKYADYISWLDGIDAQTSRAYWKKYLEGYSGINKLPTQITSTSLYDEKEQAFELTASDFEKVTLFCSTTGITQNVFIQGVWAFLLGKYNASSDVVFGLVVSGRPAELPEVDKMIGLFINTIPVRFRYDKSETVAQAFERLHSEAIDSNEHHYLNISEVVSQSEVGNQLIDHVMVFKDYLKHDSAATDGSNATNGIEIEEAGILEQNNFEFNIEVIPNPGSMRVEFNYNRYTYSDFFVQNLLKHFKQLAITLAEQPDRRLSEIPLLTKNEVNDLLAESKQEPVDFPEDTILDLFANQCKEQPDAPALKFRDSTFSYSEVDSLSNKTAGYLQSVKDIKKGDVVGIYLDNSQWVEVGILGVLKAGAAFVPISKQLPDERKAFIVEEAGIRVLLTEANEMFNTEFFDGELFAIDVELDETVESELLSLPEVTGSDLAYIIYTSGSTGRPKGVKISHGSLHNYLSWAKATYLHGGLSNYNFGLYTSLSFDLTITSLFLPLISGGCLTIFDSHLDLSTVLKEYFTSGLSCIKLTPAHISVLNTLNFDPKEIGIEMAIVGGDALHENHVATLNDLNSNMEIYNEYGPTEATVGCIVSELRQREEITIGKPIANMQVYLLNAENELVPKGVSGEICVGGAGLSLGYVERDELNAQKFIENPFEAGTKLYRTGDLGRLRFDGSFDYLGRMDNQVKVNGYRVELGEIEQVLEEKEAIDTVVVKAVQLNEQLKLVAYFTSAEKENTEELRAYLNEKLPVYMVPNYFISLTEFPLTVNGKIDRKKLPDPTGILLGGNTAYVAPRNEIEEKLVTIVSELTTLPKEEVSIEANFFDLGINSLELMKMQASMRNELQMEVPITLLFEHANIKDLAANLGTSEMATEEDSNLSQEVDEVLSDLL